MGKFSNVLLSATLLLSLVSHYATGYPNGADPSVCDSMIPGHGSPPETSENPYKITLSRTALKGFETVNITLSSKNANDIFKGFIIQVRKPGGDKTVGQFSQEVKDPNAKTMNCFKMQRSAMTQNSRVDKKSVTVEWMAPNEEDSEYQVYYTVVGANGGSYWTAITHPEKLKVTKNAEATTTVASIQSASTAQLDKWRKIYEGCGETKGCFGMPGSCLNAYDPSSSNPTVCQMIVTWAQEGEKNKFQLSGKLNGPRGYVALGLSDDASMGADSVVGCTVDGGNLQIRRYHNQGKNSVHHPAGNGKEGIIEVPEGISTLDGHLFCEFEQKDHKLADNTDINFKNSYHYLLSRADDFGESYLSKHDIDDKVASPDAYHIADILVAGASSNNWLIQLHGGLMVIAWLLCASTGMFTARYYKHTHTDFMPMGKAFWFALHVFCMAATAFLTICGAIFILVQKKGKLEFEGRGAHPILGCIVVGLAICQVVIALFRPHPNTKFRPLFNWVHWGIGNSAHIIGIACIFLAWDLGLANLKRFEDEYLWMWIMMAIVLFHVLMHIVMSIHTLWADSQLDSTSNKKRAMIPGPMKANGMSTDAPGSAFRTFMLSLYLVVMALGAIALVVLVFWPKEVKQEELSTTEPTS